ncbi:sensor histidine kinase [Pseudoalteromonas sp. H105]|uniref:sensor histidine kinase n=1 Tax=Pseudoalteromonas sp. H105 TaxID=1348393 RepID=UPI00137A9AC0|nr:sensor histidine kinase [Pseudoalteromonas sp. H105]
MPAPALENAQIENALDRIKKSKTAVADRSLDILVKQFAHSFQVQMEFAKSLRKASNHTKAIDVLKPLLNLTQLSNRELFALHTELGINYRRSLLLKKATTHYLLAKEIANKVGEKELLAKAHTNLGVLYETQSNLALAMQEQTKALELLDKSSNWGLKASVYYNLGEISSRLNKLEEASYLYSKALDNDKKSHDKFNIASTHLSLAKITIKQANYHLAITQLNNTLEHLSSMNAPQQLSVTHRLLSLAYLKTNRLTKAFKHAEISISFAQKTDSPIYKVYALMQLLELSLTEKNILLSTQTLHKVQEELEHIDNEVLLLKYHRYSALLFELTGDFGKAIQHLKKVDSYHNTIQVNYLNEATTRYMKQVDSLVQRQKLITSEQNNIVSQAKLETQKLERKIWLLAYSIVFILCVLIITLYYIKHRKAQYKARLYQSSLDLKDKMLADISHELRTPLSVLKLNIEGLEHNLQEDKSLAYQKINDKIGQLNNLISNVYQLSQVDNATMNLNNQSYCIVNLFKTYSEDLESMAENKGLTFILDNSVSHSQSIFIDKHKLDQIIYNLFKNACLYTDSPGLVRLKIHLNPSQLFIQVDDSSPGVSEPHIEHLFERLYRVEDTRAKSIDGSGLGLSICASLIKLMQGSIKIKQGKHGGLCVRVLLPLKT